MINLGSGMLNGIGSTLDLGSGMINYCKIMFEKDKTYYGHCAGGYRSMIFVSILKARGFDHLIDVKGGFKEIKESGQFKLTEYSIPTSLLL